MMRVPNNSAISSPSVRRLGEAKATSWSAYNTRLKRRGLLAIWFDPETMWTPPPSGKRGRQQHFIDASIQTCLMFKVLFGMPLRQTPGFVESLLRRVGLDWAVPNFSTRCRRQKDLQVNLPYHSTKGPLNLLIDSTGMKAEGEGAWNARFWKPTTRGAVARNEALNASKNLGRTKWQRRSGYHRRSRVETQLHCVKLPGQRLLAKDIDRQVAELQDRIAVLNRFTALGIPVARAAD